MHITYGADWLAAIASEHKLAWKPSSPFDQITVTRASLTIGADDITGRLMGEIAKSQPTANAEIELDNPALHLVVASDAPPTISVDGLTIEQRTGRLSAIVSSPAGDAGAPRQRVTGRLTYRVDVPEPTHALAAGTIIAAGDLDIVKSGATGSTRAPRPIPSSSSARARAVRWRRASRSWSPTWPSRSWSTAAIS